jgi:glycosyltransferase involved in cell wall biosynthesis
MNIVHIVPGSGGGFYCQNCVRDIGLIRALHRAGHRVMFVPLYLPMMETPDMAGVRHAPVFYGAINIYLAQKLPLYRRLPKSAQRALDAPRLLRWAARRAGTTRASRLGDLTLSMLEGRDGRQRRELDHLLDWLRTQPRPDVIHISNALLLGMVPALREALRAPIVCSLQDEDTWLDPLPPPYRERCWERVRSLCRAVDLFLPVSETYAAAACLRLGLPPDRCRTVPSGVDPDVFTPAAAPPAVPTLGFLSDFCPAHGLDRLVEAFLLLRRRPGLEALRLRLTGGNPRARTPFLRAVRRRIAASGHADAIVFENAFRPERRAGFLQSLSVFSVPSVRSEAYGLFLLEAMACGVPVVQPDRGGYPEVIAATGGGVLYEGDTPEALASALFPLLADPALATRLGRTGRESVVRTFSLAKTTARMVAAYREVIGEPAAGASAMPDSPDAQAVAAGG